MHLLIGQSALERSFAAQPLWGGNSCVRESFLRSYKNPQAGGV